MVTFLRGFVGGVPIGEWELHLFWCWYWRCGSKVGRRGRIELLSCNGRALLAARVKREAHDLLAAIVDVRWCGIGKSSNALGLGIEERGGV